MNSVGALQDGEAQSKEADVSVAIESDEEGSFIRSSN